MKVAAVWCATISVAFLGSPAHAIVTRHDRPDSRYLVDAAAYPALGHVMGRVEGALIDPRWVITAGHTVEDMATAPYVDQVVELNGVTYRFDKAVIHPKRRKGAADSDYDLALLRLTRPVVGVAPLPLYSWPDEAFGDTVIVAELVGRGATGTGLRDGKPHVRDNKLRRATNRIDAAFEHSLVFTFDTAPGGTDLEGIAGAGDSGGAALVTRDGKVYLAGVGSFNSGVDEGEASRYGTVDAYARISSHLDWIAATISLDPPSSIALWPNKASPLPLPDTAEGALAGELIKALGSPNRQAALTEFIRSHGRKASQRPPEQTAQVWMDLFGQHGPLFAREYKVSSDGTLAVLTHNRERTFWEAFIVKADPADPTRLGSISIDNLTEKFAVKK